MLNADNGTYDAWYWAHPPAYMPQNCNLDDVAHIKKFVDIPVVCAGRMEPDVGAQAVKEGKIDGVGIARQFLTDGAWVTKLMEGRLEDIQPCICCHNACFAMAHYKGVANDETMDDAAHMARCALNPQTMQGHKYDIKPAKKAKKIAVVGGGVGGMEVARIATLRGHKVTIYEKTDRLGGVFIQAAAPSFKEKDRELIEWYRRQIAALPIHVEYHCEIKTLGELDADEIVIASILRAGIPMHHGFLNVFDNASNAFVSAFRKYSKDGTMKIVLEQVTTPDLEGKVLIIVDPMLATGASIELAYYALIEKGGVPLHTHLAAVISSTDGVEYVRKRLPMDHVTLWTAAVDEEMTVKSYIVPGIGDPGDLAYGKKL